MGRPPKTGRDLRNEGRVEDGKPPIQAIAVEPGKATIPGAE